MSRLKATFESLKADGRCGLIPYITAGDPNPDVTVGLMHALANAGADVIELGVPFSDPMADGPVIQAACERALKYNTSLTDVLNMVTQFRESNNETPVILMGYLNPVERMGYENFSDRAQSVGIDGVLTVDMPPEESDEFTALLKARELDPIYLLSPTSTDARIEKIASAGSGFLYYVSLKGVTGAGHLNVDEVSSKLDKIRSLCDLPVGVGFGIRDAESAARVARVADAVVVGSALIKILEAHQDDMDTATSKITELMQSMRQAIDNERL